MRTPTRQVTRILGTTALAAGIALPVWAQSNAELRQQVATLESRLDALESNGQFRISEGTVIEVGGYVKADFILDLDEALGDVFVPESISIGDADDNERFRAHARQTRLFFKTETGTASGPLKTHIEFDLFGTGGNEIFSNSHSPRLRHAYANWNGWTIGQTWTNFMPIESYPTTVDFNGPAGIPFIRQAQIRYTVPVGDAFTVSASLENSEFSGRDAAGAISESTTTGIRAGLDGLPDFTLAAAWKTERSFVKLAGVLRELNSPVSNDSDTGWGVNLSGNANLWQGGTIQASLTYGEGVGRYILNGAGQDAFIDAAGNVNPITSMGATLGLSQELSPRLTGGLALGYYSVDDMFDPTDTEELKTVHASLFWKPADRITVGAEAIWGERTLFDGSSDDASRLQTSFQVSF